MRIEKTCRQQHSLPVSFSLMLSTHQVLKFNFFLSDDHKDEKLTVTKRGRFCVHAIQNYIYICFISHSLFHLHELLRSLIYPTYHIFLSYCQIHNKSLFSTDTHRHTHTHTHNEAVCLWMALYTLPHGG